MRVGWFRKNDRWLSCEGNKEYSEVLHAGLHVGAVNLQLIGVFQLAIRPWHEDHLRSLLRRNTCMLVEAR